MPIDLHPGAEGVQSPHGRASSRCQQTTGTSGGSRLQSISAASAHPRSHRQSEQRLSRDRRSPVGNEFTPGRKLSSDLVVVIGEPIERLFKGVLARIALQFGPAEDGSTIAGTIEIRRAYQTEQPSLQNGASDEHVREFEQNVVQQSKHGPTNGHSRE